MLSHLVYVSSRMKHCTEEEIAKILAACQKNNQHKDITGVLLYTDSHFVQYLEGNHQEIMGLYDHIKKDDRHAKAMLISSSPIRERSFPSWQMGAKKLDQVTYHGEMSQEDQAAFESVLAGQEQQSSKAIALVKKLFK